MSWKIRNVGICGIRISVIRAWEKGKPHFSKSIIFYRSTVCFPTTLQLFVSLEISGLFGKIISEYELGNQKYRNFWFRILVIRAWEKGKPHFSKE